jgi:hypothetical protein
MTVDMTVREDFFNNAFSNNTATASHPWSQRVAIATKGNFLTSKAAAALMLPHDTARSVPIQRSFANSAAVTSPSWQPQESSVLATAYMYAPTAVFTQGGFLDTTATVSPLLPLEKADAYITVYSTYTSTSVPIQRSFLNNMAAASSP